MKDKYNLPSAVLQDPELVAWIDVYRERYKFSRSDVLKMAVVEFRERHNDSRGTYPPTHEQKLAEAVRLYHQASDSIQPGVLQRHGVVESYKEAVDLIHELVARGEIEQNRVTNVADMPG